jgi:hypothetical protein
LGVGVVVSVLGCSGPPLADSGGGAESESDTQSELETETGTEAEAELGDETGGPEEEGPCVAYCRAEELCDPDPHYDYERCLEVCAKELVAAETVDGCPLALDSFYECIGELSCEQFGELWDDEDGPCYQKALVFDELCYEALTCELIGGADDPGSFCLYQYDCYGSGKHRVDCTAETGCICSIDDVEVGSCPSLYPALCEPADWQDPTQANAAIIERLEDCCGWELEF